MHMHALEPEVYTSPPDVMQGCSRHDECTCI